jgi:hypothetical protein
MNFVFTLDYELFGDGSGNVFDHMIEPTNKILEICDRYGIKITLFFEVVEYLKLKQEWKKNKMGYSQDPIAAIEKQLQKAAVEGHDIQLHIHPQWVGARYENHKWNVDFSSWRLGGFHEKEGHNIETLLKEGKTTIENLIREVVPDYNCIALRAGGYNIMPSDKIYSAMKKEGLKIDSSVFPGGYETGDLSNYDYRHVPINLDYWWACPKDITQKSENHREILVIPIFALVKPRWRKFFSIHRLKSMFFNNSSAGTLSKSKLAKKSLWGKIKFLMEKEAFTWDFFLFDSGLHNSFLNHIDQQFKERESFVLIGHPKNTINEGAFLNLIKAAEKRKAGFKTITWLYEEVKSQNH